MPTSISPHSLVDHHMCRRLMRETEPGAHVPTPAALDQSREYAGDPPAVSVILPTYQRRDLVRRAVASVFAQTFGDFELIIVDDGSTDGTREALAAVRDERLRYHWQPNRGVAAARNAALRLARGEIVAFLDSDNRWLPHHLAVLTDMLHRHPDTVLACSCPRFLVAGRKRASRARLLDASSSPFVELGRIGFVSCVAVRREAVVAIGGFDERMQAYEDTDLWMRLATRGAFSVVRRRTIVAQTTSGSLSDRAQHTGVYLSAAELSAARLVETVEQLPEPRRFALLGSARATVHLARAMRALERGDEKAVEMELGDACGLAPLFEDPRGPGVRIRRHLTRVDQPRERLRALTILAERWPDPHADIARFTRVLAIAGAVRTGCVREARRLAGEWPAGGTLRFVWRMIPVVWMGARRWHQARRHRGREGVELARRGSPPARLDERAVTTLRP